jgi:hypothetical protein
MPAVPLAPLFVIPAALIQAFAQSPAYRGAGSGLLTDVCEFDAHLGPAGVAQPGEGHTDYFLNCRQLNLNALQPVFRRIRARTEEIERECPLLAPAALLLDHICHMAVNILPGTDAKPRFFASVEDGDTEISFPWDRKGSVERSFAIYLGLSPLPIFGYGVKHEDPRVIRTLSAFGMGVFGYLYYAVVPALAAHQGMIPADIAVTAAHRPIARAPIVRQGDGSYVLEPADA